MATEKAEVEAKCALYASLIESEQSTIEEKLAAIISMRKLFASSLQAPAYCSLSLVDVFIGMSRDEQNTLELRLESLRALVEVLRLPKNGFCSVITHAVVEKNGLQLFTSFIDTIEVSGEEMANLSMLGAARIYQGCCDIRSNDIDMKILETIGNKMISGAFQSIDSTRLSVDCIRNLICTYDFSYNLSTFRTIYRLNEHPYEMISFEMVMDAPDFLATVLRIISTGTSHSVLRLAVKIIEMFIGKTQRSSGQRDRLIKTDGFMRAMARCLSISIGERIYDAAERIIAEISRGPADHVDEILKDSGAPMPQLIRLLQELEGLGLDDISMPSLIARAIWGLFARIFKNLLATPRPYMMHIFLGSGVLHHFVAYAATHHTNWLDGERICEKMRTILPPLLDLHPEFIGMAIQAGANNFIYVPQRRKRPAQQYALEDED